MRVIRVATRSWLVVDEVLRPRYLIAYAAAVHRVTGETHLLYRVDRHHLERQHRVSLAWEDTYAAAVAWCERELAMPDLATPKRVGYSSAVTPELQRERWERGLDPVTGEPRPRAHDEQPPGAPLV